MAVTVKNWVAGTRTTVLNDIHQPEVNIAIYNRDTTALRAEIDSLLDHDFECRASGDLATIEAAFATAIQPHGCDLLLRDVQELLRVFEQLTGAKSFRLLLATVKTNMCRRFHTDINDLRMLCTYSGQGTLWLTEENVNREALDSRRGYAPIALDENEIRQAATGAVLILKGAIYPKDGTKAVVHRSPTIEKTGERRLLLRIDTNEFLNF